MIDDHPSMIEGYKSILSFNDLDCEINVTPAYNCESAYYLIAENKNELRVIENKAPAKIKFCASGLSNPSDKPKVARIKENSPICAKLAPTVNAVLMG